MIKFSLDEPVFCTEVSFFVGKHEEMDKYIASRLGCGLLEKAGAPAAFYRLENYNDGSVFYVVWLEEFKVDAEWISYMVHEVQHAVSAIMEDIGMPHTESTNEAYSYYTGYLTREFITEYQKRTKRKRNGKNKRRDAAD